ncbi:phosphotransferase enzyme family protein [Psychrobacillus sp. OK032]|uniref:phosphotransferase enzyme family protein n=1 Tax=Psychrobacillus sp. OK032 TaxID=1884358 RepID=UPI0008AC039F|nr:phosphotransferase [Psychrobacillus sp. OK032]SES22674.1 Ser/Thr protein kinase RdoA involved in Cpx stress response, MazF antagonist [Psychrobacillus sp. OK032]
MRENAIRLDGGFHNDVYYMEKKGKIVRVSNARKTKEMVLQEIEWMNFLYKHAVAVPKPEMHLEEENSRVITYFEFVKGDVMDVTNALHWNEKVFEQWGKTLGRMHVLSKRFQVEEIHRPVWTVENTDVFGIRASLSSLLRDRYDRLMQSLSAFYSMESTFGMIHNDFHQGNLIITNEGIITTIDFDDCAFNWYAQDIAVAFYHAYWQHSSYNGNSKAFSQIFMNHFLSGYQTENLLHKDVIRQIPIFLKIREIYLYQLFTQKWDKNNLEEWQEYTLVDLEEKISNKTPYAGISDFSIFL